MKIGNSLDRYYATEKIMRAHPTGVVIDPGTKGVRQEFHPC